MAIPFLNSIDLNDNQLLNAKLHITGTAPTASTGQIYFDSSDKLAKYYANSIDTWVSLKQYSFSNGTFVNLSTSGTTAKPIITADLSATGTPDATVYLRGDNTWSPISAIPGTYTFDVSADVGVTQTIDSGETLNIVGGTYITTGIAATDTVSIIHDATSRTDTTSTDTPAFGGTFEAVTSVTTNSTGHVTAIDVSTITIPSSPTITLTGEVTGSGTTSITTTVSDGVLDVTNFKDSAIVIEAEGIESNDNDTTIPTSAAVKDYVDSAIVGSSLPSNITDYSSATTPLAGTELALVEQGGTFKKVAVSDLVNNKNKQIITWSLPGQGWRSPNWWGLSIFRGKYNPSMTASASYIPDNDFAGYTVGDRTFSEVALFDAKIKSAYFKVYNNAGTAGNIDLAIINCKVNDGVFSSTYDHKIIARENFVIDYPLNQTRAKFFDVENLDLNTVITKGSLFFFFFNQGNNPNLAMQGLNITIEIEEI